jgi:hypothetical protein
VSLDDSLAFWESLGYAVTYRQKTPNPYAVIGTDDYELHLFGLAGLTPEANFSTCLVIVGEVEALHASFAGRLRASLGRVPGRGFPRLSRMRPGQTRFTLTDVAGNSVIFIRRGMEDAAAAEAYRDPALSPLERSIAAARRLRDFKNDDAEAAKVLDGALARHAGQATPGVARALAMRIEIAVAQGDEAGAAVLRDRLAAIPLSDEDRVALDDEIGTSEP